MSMTALRFAIIAIIMVASALPAAALGISPARITLGPDGGSFTFQPITDGPVSVSVEGDLAQHIMLERTTIMPGEKITGTITPPADVTPGMHQQRIVISAAPAQSGTAAGQAQVAASLQVLVPYPEEYLVADWDITNDPGTGDARITVTLQNQGSRPVTPEATIAIDGETLALQTEEVQPGAFSKTGTTYHAADPGVHEAVLLVRYAGKEIRQSREAAFGTPTITISDMIYNEEAGAIKPIDVSGIVGWNRPLNTTVAISIDNDTAPAKSVSTMAQGAFSTRVYLETDRAPKAITVTVSAGSVSATKRIDIISQPQAEEGIWPLIAGVAILIILCIAIYVWRRRVPPKDIPAPSQSTPDQAMPQDTASPQTPPTTQDAMASSEDTTGGRSGNDTTAERNS